VCFLLLTVFELEMNSVYIKGIVRKGEYYDSVTLMRLAQKLGELPGVLDSAAIMGSDSNKAILESAGMLTDQLRDSCDNDLLIVLKSNDKNFIEQLPSEIDKILASLKASDKKATIGIPRTIDSALKVMPDANLAIISVAGRFAGDEAMRALQSGLHVMLFSDNVPLEKEIKLKQYAVSRGLLVMGPDCGTAIINGIPLGFANAVNRGDIGIIAASGTGLQEVSCIISNNGCGISQAIGAGSRDLSAKVGGLMFIEGIKALAIDNATRVLMLVSKPPAPETLEKIEAVLKDVAKPVVAIFLGADYQNSNNRIYYAKSLEEAALAAVALSKGEQPNQVRNSDEKLIELAKTQVAKMATGQKYIRGLFSGGTFCYEAQVLLKSSLNKAYSNSPIKENSNLGDVLKSEKHTLIDMGADEFTLGRLHPMIDFSLRNKRIVQEVNDPETAVILLDIVLGYGANMNPLDEIAPAIEEARSIANKSNRHLAFISSVTGTNNDPQNRSGVVEGLKKIGVIVTESNAAASRLAGLIAQECS
jgi:FdrA protein